MTDAGASCGANFNGLGAGAGITIVARSRDGRDDDRPVPKTEVGWTQAERRNGDKCAWISSGQGAAADITLSTGSFPVQSLWSNAFSSGSGRLRALVSLMKCRPPSHAGRCPWHLRHFWSSGATDSEHCTEEVSF